MIKSGIYAIVDGKEIPIEELDNEERDLWFEDYDKDTLIHIINELCNVIKEENETQYQDYLTEQEINDY